jgi:hypothetical protein
MMEIPAEGEKGTLPNNDAALEKVRKKGGTSCV